MPDELIGLVFDERFLLHDPGEFRIRYGDRYPFEEPVPHPSGPIVAKRTVRLLDHFGYLPHLIPVAPFVVDDAPLALVHTPDMIAKVGETSLTGGDCGTGSPIAPGGDEIARLAVGGAIAAVDAVVEGDVDRAIALLRPPGHHATRTESLGFCVYNNIAIAARHAQSVQGLQRVAIIDWDVHHGNGTQDIFYDDPSVLFISLHQENLFPIDWGKVQDTGSGDAVGQTVNVPLPAGSGNMAYLAAIDEIVLPILHEFGPELILISAGQDASVQDPLGRMTVTAPTYRTMTRRLVALANETCGGRLIALLEGGYSDYYAPYCTAAIVEGLYEHGSAGEHIPDPYSPRGEALPPSNLLSGDQRAAIDSVLDMQRTVWSDL